jgi:hypothetical protein
MCLFIYTGLNTVILNISLHIHLGNSLPGSAQKQGSIIITSPLFVSLALSFLA